MSLQFGFVIFWQKAFGAKAALKMLVKLTAGLLVEKYLSDRVNGTARFYYFDECRGHHRKGIAIYTATEVHLHKNVCFIQQNVFLNTKERS
jgi:hypothetical protein